MRTFQVLVFFFLGYANDNVTGGRYCHDSHIRQFRAKQMVTDPHVVEEDENVTCRSWRGSPFGLDGELTITNNIHWNSTTATI